MSNWTRGHWLPVSVTTGSVQEPQGNEPMNSDYSPEFVQRLVDLLVYASEELAEYSLTGYFPSFQHLEDRIEQALDQAVEYGLTEPRAC